MLGAVDVDIADLGLVQGVELPEASPDLLHQVWALEPGVLAVWPGLIVQVDVDCLVRAKGNEDIFVGKILEESDFTLVFLELKLIHYIKLWLIIFWIRLNSRLLLLV